MPKLQLLSDAAEASHAKNVVMEDINLAYHGRDGPATVLCSHVNGLSLVGHQSPPPCI
jgi:hypothetical protein